MEEKLCLICCAFIIIKGLFLKRNNATDCNPNSFWIVTVKYWPKISPANAFCLLGTIDFSNIVDIDNLQVENSK